MPPPRREDLWSQGQDETVEVNQRALIDSQSLITPLVMANKQRSWLDIPENIQVSSTVMAMLTLVFRELLQNADDAGVRLPSWPLLKLGGTCPGQILYPSTARCARSRERE
jgi:hypothetical protein